MRHLALYALVAVLLLASGLVWRLIYERLRTGRPLVPYAPRRRVPWGWRELLFVMLGYIAVQGLLAGLWLTHPNDELPPAAAPPAAQNSPAGAAPQGATAPAADDLAAAHPLVQLLAADPRPSTLIMALLAATLVAPLAEELFFRLALQGWLETRDREWARRWFPERRVPRGAVAIGISAGVFALLHLRTVGGEAPSPTELGIVLRINTGSQALASVLMIVYLAWETRASEEDLGLIWRYLRGDVLLGLAAFAAVTPLLYGVHLALEALLPNFPLVFDPVPLFALALVLGYLYYTTHRLAPSVTMHVAFNTYSLLYYLVASGAE